MFEAEGQVGISQGFFALLFHPQKKYLSVRHEGYGRN